MREFWKSPGIMLSKTPAFILSESFSFISRTLLPFVLFCGITTDIISCNPSTGVRVQRFVRWRHASVPEKLELCMICMLSLLISIAIWLNKALSRSLASWLLCGACVSTSMISVSSFSAHFECIVARGTDGRFESRNSSPSIPCRTCRPSSKPQSPACPVKACFEPWLCSSQVGDPTLHHLYLLGEVFIRGLHVRFVLRGDCGHLLRDHITELFHQFSHGAGKQKIEKGSRWSETLLRYHVG